MLLAAEPAVELPHRQISPGRKRIQDQKYATKTDWEELPRFRQYAETHGITILPFRRYENGSPRERLEG